MPELPLRAARMRLPSEHKPGQTMGTAELTALVNRYIREHYPENGHDYVLGPKDLARLERQAVRWPHAVRREALRAVLGVEHDAELGFLPPSQRRAHDAARVSVVASSGCHGPARASGTRHVPVTAQSLPAVVLPTVVGPDDINDIREAADLFRLWDASHGGGVLRQAALDRVHFAARLLGVPCPDKHRKDLYSAVGRLAQAAAFMRFDAKEYGDATSLFTFGKDCAEEVDDWSLRASIYTSMARQAFWQGDAENGRTNIEYAMVRLDLITPTERAMVFAVHARALATFGQVREALEAVAKADDAFADATDDVGYAAYYDMAEHHGETGHALSDLVRHGGRGAEAAQRRLTTAIGLHGRDYTRSRTFCQLRLARMLLATGELQEGAAVGISAVEEAASIRSARIDGTVLDLGKLAAQRTGNPDVAELHGRIRALLPPPRRGQRV
ncbi:XRE family transcriptional regulator [Lentzea sp. NPDC092896]|uniref:XRE family transcriptional regulator n=1 Tax=Lentzea sp. NPDC092896 TaxID=3364127 RepID=UPI003809EA72